jgi:lipoic acid synthetase
MSAHENSAPYLRIPPWLRTKLPTSPAFAGTDSLVDELRLHTVCRGAKCPNMFECYSKRTATFLVMGHVCTRNCAFCNHPRPGRTRRRRARRVGEAALRLGPGSWSVTS